MKKIVLGVQVEDTPESESFFNERADFLRNTINVGKNPYIGGIHRMRLPEGSQYTFILDPLFPRVYWFGFPILGVTAVLSNFSFNWWYSIGIVMSATILLFWPPVYFLACVAGLYKAGYRGKARMVLKRSRLIEAVNRFIEGKEAV